MNGACNLWLMKDDGWSFLFSVGVMGWHDFLGLKEILFLTLLKSIHVFSFKAQSRA